MPRFLARLPYGTKTDPVDEFDFEEETAGADSRKYLWRILPMPWRSISTGRFKIYGWCSRIRALNPAGR